MSKYTSSMKSTKADNRVSSQAINNEAETACRARAAVLPCQPVLRQGLMRTARVERNHTFYLENHNLVATLMSMSTCISRLVL